MAPADLSQASGFRLYIMMIQAAVEGMGDVPPLLSSEPPRVCERAH